MKGAWLEDLTWVEAGDRLKAGWPVVIPIGARAKEHGHHLPLKTDYLLAREFGQRIGRRGQSFRMVKFRTMRHGAGRVLRRASASSALSFVTRKSALQSRASSRNF